MSEIQEPAGSIDVDAEARRVETLVRDGRHAEALAAAAQALRAAPTHRDLLYLQAVSQRFLQQIPAALDTLRTLERHHPRFTRLYQERGYCHVGLRQAQPAIQAFLQAVNLNPALPASWNMLRQLYPMVRDPKNAAIAEAHVRKLASLPPAIVTATALFCDGDIEAAEQMIRAFLLEHGDHPEGMRLLARIGIELDVLDDAQLLLDAVLTLEPTYHAARFDLVQCLLKRHDFTRALAEINALRKTDAANRSYRMAEAAVYSGLGQHEQAITLYEAMRDGSADLAEIELAIGHAYKTIGNQAAAIGAYRAAATAEPSFGDAYWSLANLKTYRFEVAELDHLRTAEADPATKVVDRYHLCFALGKGLEDRGDYEESFRYYERGNALKRAETRYRPEPLERSARLQREVCTREFFAARAGFGAQSDAPIFIVGLPRAGSTLLEQILASHSQVEGTMELADVPRLVQTLQGREVTTGTPRYPGILADLGRGDFAAMGEKYLKDTLAYRTGKPRFIDKMPNNFRHLGLIRLILPNAKIIDARREPMACCFSNFKQLFASGQEFTYSIDDITRYYRMYVELMDHWNAVLPGWILRVQHEDVVADLEGNVRRLLDFCGLPFEGACLEFHKTERSVRTASSEQVRRPIYREGLDQWRHFEPWLAPMRAALGTLAD